MAQDRYDFSPEQALGILYWFGYDVSRALSELPKYTPFEGESDARTPKVTPPLT